MTNLKIEEIIDRAPLQVAPDTLIRNAILLMNQTEKKSCVLVVEQEELLGIFTERDVVKLVANGEKLDSQTITEVMSQPVISFILEERQEIDAALEMMRSYGIRHLPVVDKTGKLLGLVTYDRLYQLEENQHRESEQRDRATKAEILQNIALGVSDTAGENFLQSLVQHLTQALEVEYAFIGELIHSETEKIRTIAGYGNGQILEPIEYDLAHTPCENVFRQQISVYPEQVQQRFPQDPYLVKVGAQGYMGIPLFDRAHQPVGLIAILSRQPLQDTGLLEEILTIFAARVSAEIQRRQAELELSTALENAVEGISRLDTQGHYLSVNQSYADILGYSPREMVGMRWEITVYPEDVAIVKAAYQKMRRDGKVEVEARGIKKDGSVFYKQLVMVTAYDEQKQFKGHYCFMKDITEQQTALHARQVAELALQESERRYATLAQTVPVGIFRTDISGHCLYVNDRWCEITGLTPQEARQEGWVKALYIGDRDRIFTQWYACARHNVDFQGEYRFQRSNGTITWVFGQAIAEYNLAGELIGYVGSITDINDRKQAETALKESERKFRAIFDGTLQFIGLLNPKGIVLEANRPALDAIAANPVDVIGKPFWETPWWTHSPQLQQQLQAAIVRAAGGELVRFEAEHILADGTSVFVDFSLKPIFDEAGKVILLIPEGRDITERQETEEALRESEQRWQFALEVSGDGVWDWNAQTNEVFYSRRWKEMLGFAEEEIDNDLSEWDKRVHPDDKAHVYEEIGKYFRGESDRYVSEHRILCKDGTYKWILDRGQIVSRAADGSPVRVIGTHTDISDRKEAEEKIREQAALLDIANDAISVRDLDNRILFWSKGAERLYGWTAAEVLGQKLDLLLYKNIDKTDFNLALQKTLEQGNWQGELEKFTKNGKKILVISRWTLVRDEAGQPKSILMVNSDITEKKQLEQQFYRAQRLESLGTLASGISHDFNNILTPILAIAQLLPRKFPNLDSETEQLLAIVADNARRGADLIKQILSFARGTEGKRISLDIRNLLSEVVNIAQRTFPRDIEISLVLPTEELGTISADTTQIDQVLMNLLVNARDSMPNGGNLTIFAENRYLDQDYARLNLEAQPGNYVIISVSDTGIGITPELKERIFDPFFTTKEIGKGTGLGLATVLGIVRNHGGFIQVSSEVDRGSQFKIFLPIETVNHPQ